jgi:hypothetical protein
MILCKPGFIVNTENQSYLKRVFGNLSYLVSTKSAKHLLLHEERLKRPRDLLGARISRSKYTIIRSRFELVRNAVRDLHLGFRERLIAELFPFASHSPRSLVRKRTIPTKRPPHVGEDSANFCG